MNKKTPKIAITGGEGFLGNAIIKKLKAQKIPFDTFDFKKHNLLNPKTLKSLVSGKDTIIHLAAINRGDTMELCKINILGTLSLLEAAIKYAPNSKIIFASSFQIYLNDSIYGLTKKTGEDLILQYTKKSAIRGTVLRLSNIYGPGGKPFYNSVIATFTHLIKNNEQITINGDGSAKRDFIYVQDVAEAFIKAAQTELKQFEIIDICSGKEVPLNHILKILKIASGKNIKIVYNKTAKEKPWPTSNKNFKMAKRLLNWEPKINLNEGLTNTLNG